MSEERLQEIKDSVDFQREMLLAHNLETLCVDEEQELIDEIKRLNNIINKAIKYIKKHTYRNQVEYNTYYNDLDDGVDDLLEILKGSDKE